MSPLSRVTAERIVRCPFSVAHEYAEGFFVEAARKGAEVGIRLRDVVPTFGGRLKQPVQLDTSRRPDEAETGRGHDAFEIDWTAGTRFFPDFHGALRLRIASVEETLLHLDGEYHPPFGLPGALFDALVGRRIAAATMRDLLRRLGTAMEAREASFRASAAHPEASGTAV